MSRTFVQTQEVADQNVTQAKIANGAVGITQLENFAVTNIKLAPNCITTDKIADGTIIPIDLSDSSVTNSKLAVNAVATANITDSAVTNPKLAINAVTSTNISDSAITNSKLNVSAVTSDKIASGQVVKTLAQVGGTTLTDNVSLEGGTNILLETLTSGNKIRISSVGGSAAVNLLTNGGFTIWQRGGGPFTTNGYTADRWTLAIGSNTASISKELTFVDNSSGALKAVVTISAGVVSLSQTIENYLDYQNRAVAFTIRARPGSAASIVAKITDSNGSTSSSSNVGTGTYETLSVTRTPSVGITSLTFSVEISVSQTCYLDSAMAVQNTDPLTFADLGPAADWERSQRYYEVGYNDFSKYGASDDTTYYVDDDIDFNVVKASAPVIALTNVQVYEDGLGVTNVVSSYTLLLGITDHLLRGFSLRASKSIGGQRPVRLAFNWTATS